MDCNYDSPVLPANINNTPPNMTPPGNSNTDISQVINTSNVSKQSEVMDNDQNIVDTTTEEDSGDENVPCDPGKLAQRCYYKSGAYGSSSTQECNTFYICQKSDCGCWICDDCYKEGAHHGYNKWIKENTQAVITKWTYLYEMCFCV